MKIVQVRGANGSGKSTIARALIESSRNVTEVCWPGKRKPKVFATVMQDIGWAVIGEYAEGKVMGGCDGMDGFTPIKRAIRQVIIEYPQLQGVMFEGMMITATLWTWPTYLMELAARYDTDGYLVFLQSTLKGCLDRLAIRGTHRNNGKPVKTEQIMDKVAMCYDYADRIEERLGKFIAIKRLNVDKIKKTDMLKAFLQAVNDNN